MRCERGPLAKLLLEALSDKCCSCNQTHSCCSTMPSACRNCHL